MHKGSKLNLYIPTITINQFNVLVKVFPIQLERTGGGRWKEIYKSLQYIIRLLTTSKKFSNCEPLLCVLVFEFIPTCTFHMHPYTCIQGRVVFNENGTRIAYRLLVHQFRSIEHNGQYHNLYIYCSLYQILFI